ncbi:MAG TPA: hypothetical protein VGE98_06735, partial [Thermoanaerobaculia bacterium]
HSSADQESAMNKTFRKLDLHRDTVRHLDRAIAPKELQKALGNGPQTSETTHCCTIDPTDTSVEV